MKAQRLSRKTLFRAYSFDLVLDRVRWPNGMRLDRSLIVHRGISVIVPQLDEDRLVLVRQYRYGAGRALWEVPAGTLSPGEAPERCARRELEEEIGYRAGSLKKLAVCYASPGFNTEKIHCYRASKLKKTRPALEHDEILTPRVFTRAETMGMIRARRIQDAKSLVALFYFFAQEVRR
jgi:ADP-ribose pyrophosphatase